MAMNWEKARRQEIVKIRGGVRAADQKTATKRMPKGITNAQAKFLAGLQRQLGEPYTGHLLNSREASVAIDGCLERLGRNKKAA